MKLINKEYLYIKEFSTVGTRRPRVFISGVRKINDKELLIKVHGNEVKHHNMITPTSRLEGGFHITSILPVDVKEIELYVKDNDKEVLIATKKTSFIGRVFGLILSKIKKVLETIWIFIRGLFNGLIYFIREYHLIVPKSKWKTNLRIFKRSLHIRNNYYDPENISDYTKWIKHVEEKPTYKDLDYSPLITVIMYLDNPKLKDLNRSLSSILNQYYKNYELLIVDNKKATSEVNNYINNFKDYRVTLVDNNYIDSIKGEYITFINSSDLISENYLYELVKELNKNKDLELIYTDEDKIGYSKHRYSPFFKPNYSPDTLLSNNYIGYTALYKTKVFERLNGVKKEYEEAFIYDLNLRYIKEINKDKIYHVPKILYHVRRLKNYNKEHVIEMETNVLKDYLNNNKIEGRVHNYPNKRYYYIEYSLPKNKPLVSIIIPTRDLAEITENCIKSIYDKSTYDNFEIIIANNNSEKEETFKMFDKYKNEHSNFRVIDINTEFNYSNINNIAVKNSKGDYVVLLNNDTVVITPNWLELMVGYAMQNHVGAVGAKLLYPDDKIQHAGIIAGIGVASHAFIGEDRDAVGINGRLVSPYNYAGNTAACLMVSKKKYNEVKGLDETLKVCYNDVDFNLKLLDRGYYNINLPIVELYHYESKSRGQDDANDNKFSRFVKESEQVTNKWDKYIKEDPYYNPNFSKCLSFMLDKKE